MNGRKKSHPWSVAVRVGVSLGLLGVLCWAVRDRLGAIAGLLSDVQRPWVAGAVACYVGLTALFLTARLQQTLRAVNVQLPFGFLFRLNYVSLFFNNFLPTATGGDLVKAYYLGRGSEVSWMAWLGVLADRAVGVVTFFLCIAAAFVFGEPNDALAKIGLVYMGMTIVAGVGVSGAVVWARRTNVSPSQSRWLAKLQPLLIALKGGRRFWGRSAAAVGYSIAAQLAFIVAISLLARGLSLEIPFTVLLLVVPLVATASMVPSVNGLGVREAALVLCLQQYVGQEPALALAVLLLGLLVSGSLVGGVLYALQGGTARVGVQGV